MQQGFFNLLRNGIEARQDKARRELRVQTNLVPGGMAQISVADTGSGLPDEVRHRLFERSVTTKANGMEIGLPLVGLSLKHTGAGCGLTTIPVAGQFSTLRFDMLGLIVHRIAL